MSPVRRVATWLPLGTEVGRFDGGNRVATCGPEVEWHPGCQEKGAWA